MPSFFPDTFLSSVPRGTSLAGLDIGAKTIGVAVSDTLWLTATPLKTIFRKSFQKKLVKNFLKNAPKKSR